MSVIVSAVSLASKCSTSAFRMHIRAHDTFMKMLSSLHDAAHDPVCDILCLVTLSVTLACLYSLVLSLLQKPVNVRLMSRTVSANEFQIEGPEAAKLRDPYHANRLHGIVRS